ncbi:Ribosome inactivating protein [Micromonospora haikouensis]|uniref:Ribosome inactivating protein n=1 Tax=Micromonospora haikouensis TaxID=686309 RepID=A0A1C4XJK3_9ACTN|nr:ribosome-inactivating family protein [Micromonospora haikouensis]SCF08627.1 Ribosome inactivating protein [Micromonospora haikouensis]
MSLLHACRGSGRRISALFVALVMMLGIATVPQSPAHAQPGDSLSIIDWNISRITDGGDVHESRYFNMIAAIHTYSGNYIANEVMQTNGNYRAMIQVRVLDTNNAHLVSLYFWADNLYLAAWYSPTNNRHYLFSQGDRWRNVVSVLGLDTSRVTVYNMDGNYNELVGGNSRSTLVTNPQRMYDSLRTLGRTTTLNNDVSAALVQAITMTSEAARYSPILDTIRYNIRYANRLQSLPLNDDNVWLTTHWGTVSAFVHRVLMNPSGQMIVLYGRIAITTLAGLISWLKWVEINGYIV